MISLREFLKKKEKDEFRDKLIQHRLVVIYRTVLIVAALVVIGLVVYMSFENRIYSGYEVVSEVERQDSDIAVYIPYNGNVLKYSQDGAEAFDGYNNALWNETFEMQNPTVATCGNYAALGDFKGNVIYVVGASGEEGKIETKLPVSMFCISGKGVVAAVLEDDNETWINLYQSSGEVLAGIKCTMTQSGYPVDISLSEDGMKLGVSYMRIENGELKSSVAFYNFGEVGQNEIDNYVSGYDYVDTVVPKVKFINNSTAFALGDDRLVIYNGNQKPTSTFETFLDQEVQSVFYGEKSIGLVFRADKSENKYRLDIYSESGDLDLSQEFNIDYTDIALKDDLAIIYNDTKCLIYKFNGAKKYEGEFASPALLLVPTGNRTKYILVNREAVETIRLR